MTFPCKFSVIGLQSTYTSTGILNVGEGSDELLETRRSRTVKTICLQLQISIDGGNLDSERDQKRTN